MKTQLTKVDGKAYIWAVPKGEYTLGQEIRENGDSMVGICPFKYDVTCNESDWRSDSVLVAEFDIVGTVPAGIDLVLKAVETLRNQIVTIQAEAEKEVAKIEEKIRKLALIEYKPEVVSEQ